MNRSYKVRLRIALAFVLVLILVVPGNGQEPGLHNPNPDVWSEAVLMQLRQRQDGGETLWKMYTFVIASRQKGSTPETVRAAVQREQRRLRQAAGQGGDGHTQYKAVLQLIGGFSAMLPAPQLKAVNFAIGAMLGGGFDRAVKGTMDAFRERDARVLERDRDRLYANRLEREIVSAFRVEMKKGADLRDIGVRNVLPPQFSRPDDPVATILERHPEFHKMRLLMDTSDTAKRNGELISGVKNDLEGLHEDMQGGFEALRKETRDIRFQLMTAEQRRIQEANAARALQVKLEGLRGAAFIASTVIGWNDPRLGSQVSAVAVASIDVYEAFDAFRKVIRNDTSGNLTGFATAALTGNILAAVMPVIDIFLETGPSPEQQILDAVETLRDQVKALHEEMHARFNRVDDQLRLMAKRMEEGLDLILQNQIEMRGRLQDIQLSLQNQKALSAHILAEIRRQERVIVGWLIGMHLKACLIRGNTHAAMPLNDYELCRSKLVAPGENGMLREAQKAAGELQQTLRDFNDYPDDMTQVSLQAFDAATVHETESLPATVVGPERLDQIASMVHEFLLRWPEYLLQADLQATTLYAAAMKARFAALRAFSEAARRDLFRFANPHPDEDSLENAFHVTLENAWKAYEDMRLRILSELRMERETFQLIWPHSEAKPPGWASRAYSRDVVAKEFSDAEMEEVVQAALKRGNPGGFAGQWDVSHLTRYTPAGFKDEREYLAYVMDEMQSAFYGDDWAFIRMMMRRGFVTAILEQAVTENGRPVTVKSSRRSDGGFRPMVIAWSQRPEQRELRSNLDWTWKVIIDNKHEMAIVLRTSCSRGSDEFIIRGSEYRSVELDVTLRKRFQAIEVVRDNSPPGLLADHAIGDLSTNISRHGKRGGRRLSVNMTSDCADEIQELFESDREQGSKRISERLARTEEWQRWNASIDLAESHIKSWIRLVLFEAAAHDSEIARLLAETTVRSPATLMRDEGLTIWEAMRETSENILQLRRALKHPAIVNWLREKPGHDGVLRTKYLGIDAVPEL